MDSSLRHMESFFMTLSRRRQVIALPFLPPPLLICSTFASLLWGYLRAHKVFVQMPVSKYGSRKMMCVCIFLNLIGPGFSYGSLQQSCDWMKQRWIIYID
jgi:hypothetical protein